jgi:methyl-accepting chemotaxis protein
MEKYNQWFSLVIQLIYALGLALLMQFVSLQFHLQAANFSVYSLSINVLVIFFGLAGYRYMQKYLALAKLTDTKQQAETPISTGESFSFVKTDLGYLPQFGEVMAKHIDSANTETEQGALKIMEVLDALYKLSGNLLERLSKNVQQAQAIKEVQAERLTTDQELLTQMYQYIEAKSNQAQSDHQRIQEVLEQVKGLSGLTGLIRNIAKQTNLLALNASIEAARAGDAGRGFAVVADEVRNLSQETETVTASIDRAIIAVSDTVSKNLSSVLENDHIQNEMEKITEVSSSLQSVLKDFSELNNYVELLSYESQEAMTFIHNGIVEALGNMQFQDISRQQLESVQSLFDALIVHFRELSTKLDEMPPGPIEMESLEVLLESHRHRYVMRRQQENHNDVLGKSDNSDNQPVIELF